MRTARWFRAAGLLAAAALAAVTATVSGSAGAAAPGGTGAAPVGRTVHTSATETTVRLGPFVLPAAPSSGIPIVNQFRPDVPKPCEDCFITAVEPRLVDAAGKRADMGTGVMLHHLVISEPGQNDVTCGRNGVGALGRRIFATGDERTPIRLPDGFGYRVNPGPWVSLMELMNSSSETRIVYFEAVVHHVLASTAGMKPIVPVWLDMDNCYTSVYAVPAGRSAQQWSWVSTLTGRIVAAGGHVHAGGVGLTLDNTTTKQRICGSTAGYGSGVMAGHVTSMSTCSWDSLGALHAGDTLVLTSIYDSPKAQNDVMGIMLLAVYETDDVDGGTKAPASMRRTPATHVPDSADGHHMDMGGHDMGGHDMGGHDMGGGNPPH